jgi:Ca-activated chloride channel family protein
VAITTVDVEIRNNTGRRTEATLVMPVPDGAVVRSFTFQGAGAEPVAEVLPADVAAGTYHAIVSKLRDPALLEFIGYNLLRTSVFPVAAQSTQKIRLTYEHVLESRGDRVDYELPRSESLDYHVPWTLSVRIKSKRPISTVYSPTHALETVRAAPNVMSVRVGGGTAIEPGPFRLSYLAQRDGITASLFAYPDATVGGGYFLLLGGVPATLKDGPEGAGIKREVILVMDRSGSMRGEKLEQAREAARQVLAGLEPGESFNILTYSDYVDSFAAASVIKSEHSIHKADEFLRRVQANGGTNIHDALFEALRLEPKEGTLPVVLFLTDGLPTIGQTSEPAIRNVAMQSNPHEKRVFTFGVGVDVNAPLLDKIATETRSTSTYVLPGEDVEVKVAQVFGRLSGPVLADARLAGFCPGGVACISELIPGRIPDLFEGGQLVVLGKYVGDVPTTFRLTGNYLGRRRSFEFKFGSHSATTKNAFVSRLWASRKIGTLTDAIRQLGASGSPAQVSAAAEHDPRLKELIDEIVRLSTKFGILTEYTAFLTREGTDLFDRDRIMSEAQSNFVRRAIRTRSGKGAVNQAFNYEATSNQMHLNHSNAYWDAEMNRVSVGDVQQVNDLAFYRRNNQWIDSRLVKERCRVRPTKTIEFGSQQFRQLAGRLARQGRSGSISLRGDVLIEVDGEPVLVRGPSH